MMPPWLDMCCLSIKRPLPQVMPFVCDINIMEGVDGWIAQVTLDELMLRISGSRMLLMLCE